ncbi:MAG TPA: hypothetical protein VK628_03195 [Flavitalea sp.]|nr:hypothetical protein [Flavitalea sp.]
MKYDNQLRYAGNIISAYDGSVPLSGWLNQFFREHPQMGSKDRRTVSSLVYGYYRLGQSQFPSTEQKILAAAAIMNTEPGFTEYFATQPGEIDYSQVFPWEDMLSKEIDTKAFTASFLVQPDVFLRIRPGKRDVVLAKLKNAGVAYEETGPDCLAVVARTRVDQSLELDREVVVQDRSSQETGKYLSNTAPGAIWDCCAGSGGKSIMAYDLLDHPMLLVSDLRPSILINLKKRFIAAGISDYRAFFSDLTKDNDNLPDKQLSLIIADLPCTGSGTWSRTPEQLFYFDPIKLQHYVGLQRKIISRLLNFSGSQTPILYITCSVFAAENEEMAEFIQVNSKLKLRAMELIKGYNVKADTMFAALFIP